MPAERIGMRDAREIIRLKFSGVSMHEIARRLGMARSTVREMLKRTEKAGLSWPLPEDLSDGGLEAGPFERHGEKEPQRGDGGVDRGHGDEGGPPPLSTPYG